MPGFVRKSGVVLVKYSGCDLPGHLSRQLTVRTPANHTRSLRRIQQVPLGFVLR